MTTTRGLALLALTWFIVTMLGGFPAAWAEASVAPAAAAETEAATRTQRLEEAWSVIRAQANMKHTLLRVAPGEQASAGTTTSENLRDLLEKFLATYPEPENPYLDAAREILTKLNDEPQAGDARKLIRRASWRAIRHNDLRTQTEWLALRVVGGSMGAGFEATFFTLRWRYVVWELLRGGLIAPGPGFRNERCLAAQGGTALGAQIQVGPSPVNELRFMTGLFGGMIMQGQHNSSDEMGYTIFGQRALSAGPFVLVEASWVHHFLQHVALQVGIEALVSTLATEGAIPDPILMAFVGIRI